MALIFPSDNELFDDLNIVGNKNIDITTHIKNRAFGIVYRAKLSEIFDIDNKNIVNAENEIDALDKIKQGNHQDYLDMEATVDEYLHNYKTIGYFPGSELNWYGAKNIKPIDGDYFKEMDKSFGFMKGIGYFGKQLKLSNKKLKEIEQLSEKEKQIRNSKSKKSPKTSHISPVSFRFTALGLILLLSGGSALPVVPDFLSFLINNSFWIRRIISLLMGISGILVMSMTKIIMEEASEDFYFTKIPGNGLVTMAICLCSVMSAYSTFSDANIEPFSFVVLGIYYIFYSVCFFIDERKSNLKLKKNAELEIKKSIEQAENETISAKLDYCMGVEAYINELYRYLRFHILWLKNINPDKPLPTGIIELQKSFDYIVEKYNQYN